MKKPKLKSKIVRVETLSDSLKRQMFTLFEIYYVDVNYQRFCQDLSEKTHVFLFYSMAEVVGFSTILRKRLPKIANGIFLYSGDTVLREDCWGSKILQRTFFEFIVNSKLRSPHQPVYWMLMSKGFKTYMMMRKNFGKSYPNFKEVTPPQFQMVLNEFYNMKFGSAYDAKQGLVVFAQSLGAVKSGVAEPTAVQMGDAEVSYFLKRNPRYQAGEELACIAEIRFEDFLGHIPKFFIKLGKSRR